MLQIPGRVGDASIAGGGAYAESGVGGCASTGDGDLHLRFLPCYQVTGPETIEERSHTSNSSCLFLIQTTVSDLCKSTQAVQFALTQDHDLMNNRGSLKGSSSAFSERYH